MKKIFTLLLLCVSAISAYSQKNLFDAADVDADGWLWLDTQEKIDKYVGMANNEDGKIDPNGKLIQMVCADFGDYADCETSATEKGAGTDGNLGGPNAKTGYVMIPGNSAMLQTNGGSIVVRMPSCSSFAVCISSETSVKMKIWGTSDESMPFIDYGQSETINAKYTAWSSLCGAGIYTWSGIETLTNGFDDGKNLTQLIPCSVRLQSFIKSSIYIHGIKAITKEASNLSTVSADAELSMNYASRCLTLNQPAEISVYTTTGVLVLKANADALDMNSLAQGVYLVKASAQQVQQSMKICVR